MSPKKVENRTLRGAEARRHMETLIKERRGRPLSSQQRREQILRKPAQKWPRPGGPAQGLSYNLTLEIDTARIELARRFTGDSPLLDFQRAASTRLAVTHSAGRRRIESKNNGLFGRRFAYVSDDAGRMLFLDLAGESYLQCDADQIPDIVTPELGRFRKAAQEGPRIQGRSTRRLVFSISSPQPCRLEFCVCADEELRPYAREVTATLLGCPDNGGPKTLIDQIAESGLPLQMEVYLEDGHHDDRPFSRALLRSVSVARVSPDLFTIPQGFANLRNKRKPPRLAPEKGFTTGRPVRFSKVRPGRRGTGPCRTEAGHPGSVPCSRGESNVRMAMTTNLNFAEAPSVDLMEIPECLPATYDALLATEIEQTLMDDLRFVLNTVSTRLSGFRGRNGKVVVDWLDQFQQASQGMAGGDGLFCFLRDVPDPAAADPEEQAGGQGLLDRLVEREVRRHLSAGTLPTSLNLSAAVQGDIGNVMGNTGIDPADRFDRLAPANQVALREAYLDQQIARFEFGYTSDTGWQTIFHDLLKVRIQDLEFDLDIGNNPVIDTLTVGDNEIHLAIKLPDASGKAWLARVPSTLYWLALGASGIACFFLPFLCSLAVLVAAVGLFLLMDFAYVRIELSDLEIDVRVSFQPNGNGALVPAATVDLDCDIGVVYISVVPTGVHQILSLIYSIILSHTSIVVNELESALGDAVDGLLNETLGLSFPPPMGAVSLGGLSSWATGIAGDHLYLQSGLDADTLSALCPYLTQVDDDIRSRLLGLRDKYDTGAGRNAVHYGGLVLSQNFLNLYANILWRRGEFRYEYGGNETATLFEMLQQVCPSCRVEGQIRADLQPVVSPRVVLSPSSASAGGPYVTTFFDDLRLCFYTERRKPREIAEFQFAAEAKTQVGFGAVDAGQSRLDIMRVGERLADLYFQLRDDGLRIVHPDVQGIATEGPAFATLTESMLPALQELFLKAFLTALVSRSDEVVPHEPGDPQTVNRYPLVGQSILMDLTPHRGNLYVHSGMLGLLQWILPSSGPILDIDSLNCADGEAMREFV